ncbi:hypothetical protein BLNAU_9353 [Blattamonas nauphoetae]|uniref:Uncharacterized protein n=1 Tax=Blattamonas nauphoetae TaxID=2049346 RepID=A0ABQ9XW01_9EUKA|nr:hypothetical protein BLNAU_9353 [Blattamonas nauphoetae]
MEETINTLKLDIREKDECITNLRNDLGEKAFLEKKLSILQAIREKERARFMEEIEELRERLAHEQDMKKFSQTKVADTGSKTNVAKGDIQKTLTNLTVENQRLTKELEYQGENSDLLLRENTRLNKVVQTLQVEASLQKTAVEELTRKCKIKDKIIETLRMETEQTQKDFALTATPQQLQTPAYQPETVQSRAFGQPLTFSQLVSSSTKKPQHVQFAKDYEQMLTTLQLENDQTKDTLNKIEEKLNEVWEGVVGLDLSDIRRDLESISGTDNVIKKIDEKSQHISVLSSDMYHLLESIGGDHADDADTVVQNAQDIAISTPKVNERTISSRPLSTPVRTPGQQSYNSTTTPTIHIIQGSEPGTSVGFTAYSP